MSYNFTSSSTRKNVPEYVENGEDYLLYKCDFTHFVSHKDLKNATLVLHDRLNQIGHS